MQIRINYLESVIRKCREDIQGLEGNVVEVRKNNKRKRIELEKVLSLLKDAESSLEEKKDSTQVKKHE